MVLLAETTKSPNESYSPFLNSFQSFSKMRANTSLHGLLSIPFPTSSRLGSNVLIIAVMILYEDAFECTPGMSSLRSRISSVKGKVSESRVTALFNGSK